MRRTVVKYGDGEAVLPLRLTHSSSSLATTRRLSYHSPSCSCWYCDFKIFTMNEPLLHLGQRYSRYLRVWFSIGVGVTLALLLGVILALLYELACALHVLSCKVELGNLLFGFFPMVFDWRFSLANAGYIILSTMISVAYHEFGHAVAAASEGIQAEYVAVFMAVLFPGALVAFDYELLQALPNLSALRIYCAGIWHNAVICTMCGLGLLLLPFILSPMYIHGQSPMVLDVPDSSPLYGYLSPHDIIVSLDGIPIHNPQEWVDSIAMIDGAAYQDLNYTNQASGVKEGYGEKGYCLPRILIEERKKIELQDNISTCPYDLSSFIRIPCSEIGVLDYLPEDVDVDRGDHAYCLNSQEIVMSKRCGTGWPKDLTNRSSCTCSEDESCLAPVQNPGSTWVEIRYASPYSDECLQFFQGFWASQSTKENCIGSFIYVGDVMSLANSVWLTVYQPRWPFGIGAYLPFFLEKILTCSFYVSLMLAIVNSLPVFFLDGESILEACLCHGGLLTPRKRKRVLRVVLLAGTLMSVLALLRMVHVTFQ